MKVAVVVCCLTLYSHPLGSSEPLALKVMPAVAMAPAFVRVEARIELDADNRALEIVAESPDFFRGSEIQLDGAAGPRTRVFDFPHLPAGLYEVTGVLIGSHGKRAIASRVVKVTGGASSER